MNNVKQTIAEDSSDNILLQTIKVPKNILLLSDRLPQSNYVKFGMNGPRKNNQSQEPILPNLTNTRASPKRRGDNEQSPNSLDKNRKKYTYIDGTPIKQQQNNNVNIHVIDKNLLPDIAGNPRQGSPKARQGSPKKDKNNIFLGTFIV